MKILYAFFIALLISTTLTAQEFSFTLAFEDAVGNTDTIVLGYDMLATDSVDTSFNEVNIINTPWDSVFEVRITDELHTRVYTEDSTANYHLKKQIIKNYCGEWPPAVTLDIKCNNWPVTMSWDSTLFNDSCNEGSFIYRQDIGFGWDVILGASNIGLVLFSSKNQTTFTANYQGFVDEYSSYVNDNLDTISVFWVNIGDSLVLKSDVHEIETPIDIRVSPVPTESTIQLSGNSIHQIETMQLFDLSGNQVAAYGNQTSIDLNHYKAGIYILYIQLKDKTSFTQKVIKL